jgi:DNA polymerase-3 subunit beta
LIEGWQKPFHPANALPAFPLVQEPPALACFLGAAKVEGPAQPGVVCQVHDILLLERILFVAEGKQLRWPPHWRFRPRRWMEVPKQEVILPRKTVLEMQRPLRKAIDAVRRQPGQVQF